jgi:hypothetical protein
VSLPEVHIETDGTPMHTKVILKTGDGLEWNISDFTTRIEQMSVEDGRPLRTTSITIIANTDLPLDGEPLILDANEARA